MMPMNIMLAYNMATLFLFIFGAWNYNVTNYSKVIFVVMINLAALYFGYYFVIHSHKDSFTNEQAGNYIAYNDIQIIGLLKKWTIISAIIAVPDMLYYSRMWTLSFGQIVQRLIIGLTESNLNYSLSLGYENSGTVIEKVVVLVTVILYIFKFAVLPLSLLLWRQVDSKQKVLCVFVVAMDIIKWLLKGMNKGIFDYAFVFLAATLIVVIGNKRLNVRNIENKGKKKRSKIIFLSIVTLALAVQVFISNIAARSSKLTTAFYSTSMHITADPHNIILSHLPVAFQRPFLSLEMYLTCGYQGLSYALRLPFKWCYGIGNNQFAISNFRDAFGLDVSKITYQARVEEVFPWQEYHNWHTAYTWLANDFSFYLLPIIFFVLGCVFALSWLSSIEKHNPYAIIIFCLFVIRIAYLPANNIILSSSFTFIAWYVALILWFLSSHRYSIKIGHRILFNQKF